MSSNPKPEKKRQRKEKTDHVCDACRERNHGSVPEHACNWCKEEQEKFGRRAWTTTLQLGAVHLGDMIDIGEQIPNDSVDTIFTDPPYIDALYQQAYAGLGEIARRVLKPYGFLFTYAPQAHLEEIFDLILCSGDVKDGELRYFWIIQSLNSGPAVKAHKWNALCLHKPILVFQKVPVGKEIKGSRRCFADVVRGYKQKRFHPWQQSVHDVLGIIDRFMVPGEILLDPFAGTGTSLIAAQLLGMEWIGFEIDPKTHAIAVRELQQKPMDLFTFGGEEPEIPAVREVPEEKDQTHQAEIYDTTGKTVKQIWHDVCDKCEEDCKGQDDPKCLMKRTKGPSRPDPENPISKTCIECDVYKDCLRKDPYAGCRDAVLAIRKANEERDLPAEPSNDTFIQRASRTSRKIKRPTGAGTGGGPQPAQQGACGTCGHHKGRKTFHESCPRLGELVFKGGTKSAKVLMQETERERCGHWIEKRSEGQVLYFCKVCRDRYTCQKKPFVDCDGPHSEEPRKKEIPAPSAETCPGACPYKKKHPVQKHLICAFVGKALIEMKECPTPILSSSNQAYTINQIKQAIDRQREGRPSEDRCQCFTCPDGVMRCGIGDKACPHIKTPFRQLRQCPQMSIPVGYLFPGTSKRSASKKSKTPKKEDPKP